jgi:hypothetical protein
MNNTFSRIPWDGLVNYLGAAKFSKIKRTQRGLETLDDVYDTGHEASKQSDIDRYNLTPQERKTIRALDHHCCFVTNTYSHMSKIAYILDSCNAKNGDLVVHFLRLAVEM